MRHRKSINKVLPEALGAIRNPGACSRGAVGAGLPHPFWGRWHQRHFVLELKEKLVYP